VIKTGVKVVSLGRNARRWKDYRPAILKSSAMQAFFCSSVPCVLKYCRRSTLSLVLSVAPLAAPLSNRLAFKFRQISCMAALVASNTD